MTEPSLPADQRTIVTRDALGTKIEAIPGMGVCDFCAGVPVAYLHACGLVVIANHVSSDPWGACAECHALVAADDLDGLLQRVTTVSRRPPHHAAYVRDVLQAFFAARFGTFRPV